MKINIGEFIKNRRIGLGMTQTQLAEAIDVNERTLRRIENNEYKDINSATFSKQLLKIAEELKLTDVELKALGAVNYNEAMNYLNPANLVLDNSINDLHHKLYAAQSYAQNKQYKEALNIYLAFEQLSDEPFYKLGCATMYQFLNKFDDAISYCEKVLLDIPESFEAHFIKGTCLASQKENDLAIKVFNDALHLKEHDKVYYNIGVLYMSEDSYPLAINAFEACLRLNSKNASAHLNLGICLFKYMNYEKSLQHYKNAIEIEPNLYMAYSQIGEYYRFFGKYAEAVENFEVCLLLDAHDFQSLYGIAFSYLKLNRISEAALYYKFFINHHKNKLFPNKLTATTAIVDIGYVETTFFSIQLETNDIAIIKIDNIELPIKLQEGKSYIFIGAPIIADTTGSMPYAILGKFYTVKEEFQKTVNTFKDKANLFQFFDRPIYVDTENNISANVIERNKHILIEIYIKNSLVITGITDQKSGGLETFMEHYNKHGQYRLHFEHEQEVFIVDGLKNVHIEVLNSI
ncbi:tetratricopeptide repeat protein [Lysinibacillus sp. TE18511]